jgi:hypothetical protein
MPVSIEQVPMWGILDGIGHAIQRSEHGWSMSACNCWSPSFHIQKERPKRICSKCRKRLREATLVQSTNDV